MKLPGWKWPLSKTPIPPEYAVYLAQNRSAFDKDRYYCKMLVKKNKLLTLALIYIR